MKNLISGALLFIILLPHQALAGQGLIARDDAQRIKRLSRILETGSYRGKSGAILELSWPKSREAGRALLKRLKHNLAEKGGNQQYPWASSSGGMTLWGSYPSENELLVTALAKQGYAEAVPTMRKMLRMKPERSGISRHNLAYLLNQITGEPVEYEEGGRAKRFPEEPVKP